MPDLDPIALNERQREAVTAPMAPVLVLAGPGHGQDARVDRAHRVSDRASRRWARKYLGAHLYQQSRRRNANPLGSRSGQSRCRGHHRGDISSFCVDVLRQHRETAGLPRHFGIADEDLQRTLIYRAFPRLNPNEGNLNNVMQNVNA